MENAWPTVPTPPSPLPTDPAACRIYLHAVIETLPPDLLVATVQLFATAQHCLGAPPDQPPQ
jgi:hypothetical protein